MNHSPVNLDSEYREGPIYGSRRYGSVFFGPNEIWPFSLELSPPISGGKSRKGHDL